jgi:hypothetical protein
MGREEFLRQSISSSPSRDPGDQSCLHQRSYLEGPRRNFKKLIRNRESAEYLGESIVDEAVKCLQAPQSRTDCWRMRGLALAENSKSSGLCALTFFDLIRKSCEVAHELSTPGFE